MFILLAIYFAMNAQSGNSRSNNTMQETQCSYLVTDMDRIKIKRNELIQSKQVIEKEYRPR